jgi:hypothetical protein
MWLGMSLRQYFERRHIGEFVQPEGNTVKKDHRNRAKRGGSRQQDSLIPDAH